MFLLLTKRKHLYTRVARWKIPPPGALKCRPTSSCQHLMSQPAAAAGGARNNAVTQSSWRHFLSNWAGRLGRGILATEWAGKLSWYTDWLRAGRSGIESRWGRDFAPVQTDPGAHPASCKMGTGSFPGVKCSRGVLLTTHPLLVPRSWKSRAIPLPTLWAKPDL